MPTLQIRPDILEQYSSLFGARPVNGRTLVVEDLIANMTVAIGAELQQLLAARYRFQEEVARGAARYDFPPGTEEVGDADGHRATAAAIKYGSRVLLSIVEQPEPDRTAILDAIFGDRKDLLTQLARAGDTAGRARIEKALQACDYVYDVPHALAPAV